ncbi:MAG: hypothetical protein LBD51_04085 [Bifidobacteriaceae bacterium]|jgi:hypothetical protein|nr:hypothetical protein [Bifidobacteriaceae bacterium]
MTKRHLWFALPLAAALALTACAGGEGVATLGDKPQASQRSQAERARDMVKCLQDEGIAATFQEWDAEQADVGFDSGEPYVVSPGDGSATSGAGEGANTETEADWDRVMRPVYEMAAKYDPSWLDQYGGEAAASAAAVEAPAEAEPADEGEIADEGFAEIPPYLIIGDQDYTEAYTECLESTGFTAPEYKQDPAEELKEKQRTLEATNTWLKCARDNGYPNLADPPAPKADEYQTQPMALLPANITEPELRALLEACPNFNAEDMAAGMDEIEQIDSQFLSYSETMELYEDLMAKYPGMIEPSIGFDAPGFNGDWTAAFEETDSADLERLSKLQEVLSEAANAFYEARMAEAG